MEPILEQTAKRFAGEVPEMDFWSLRLVSERKETLAVRQDIVQPPDILLSRGAFITVVQAGGAGYAATSDLSPSGLRAALERAREWAVLTARRSLLDAELMPRCARSGRYETPVHEPWEGLSNEDKIGQLQKASRSLKVDDRIVDWWSWLVYRQIDTLLVSGDGAWIEQRFHIIDPGLKAVANAGSQTQVRTGGGARGARQGGLEQLQLLRFTDQGSRVAEEALALLEAPECPPGRMDLLLMPSQMALQIHESIGHPLELDRILGDERNYAGTSFVTPEMFGRYRYGSTLLNVTFDPGCNGEAACYGFDDEGTPAERVHLIRNGLLQCPLGGAVSQARAGLPGTANARACDWDRPPIDRMANLNIEPGQGSLRELIAGIEHGVLMDTNRSWSIDDSRNKFQFGCELGRLVEDGELKGVVRNPNYRGVSATFWRSLSAVGGRADFELHGVTNCGKGEPNQMIHVGHASPPCVFRKVDVFGGED
ncbi:MAG: TldD/PmbA family protein [Gammaproteobacteria bacterium]|nr:TldD/PmbA family protein [Gammaproteobacteria bacterium]